MVLVRIWAVLPPTKPTSTQKRPSSSTCTLGVFLGSGGHTAEMKTLLSTLDYSRYTPRTYVLCHGDEMSLRTISTVEGEHDIGGDVEKRQKVSLCTHHAHSLLSDYWSLTNHGLAGSWLIIQRYDILLLPRAREVGQSLPSTAISTFYTILLTVHHLFLLPLLQHPSKPWVDVLLVNGPGTCVVLVLVSYIRRILGLSYTKIIYVESFARVKTLSLSAKLLKPFVDKMVVQWPEMGGSEGKRVDYRGWLV